MWNLREHGNRGVYSIGMSHLKTHNNNGNFDPCDVFRFDPLTWIRQAPTTW